MLEQKIESILFFKNEPVAASELQKLLGASKLEIKDAIQKLQDFYKNRGIVIVTDGESVLFGTHPEMSLFIETIRKEELSRELTSAGLETLAIILYRGPISRREIDQIRGVNSYYTLRNLLIRGLVEKDDRVYKPTIKLLEYLGVAKREELPEFETAFKKLDNV